MSTAAPVATAGKAAPCNPANRFILAGGLMLATLALLAISAPLIAPHDPEAVEVRRVLGAPDLQHLFGSDVMGRDVMSRIIHALRVSLLVSLSAVAASLVIAVPLGLLAGYFGSWVDTTISRSIDMILVLPAMLLAITFIAILGPGSVVAAPGQLPSINPTGNARLASAGTGDVLAGWLGGTWAQHQDGDAAGGAFDAAHRVDGEVLDRVAEDLAVADDGHEGRQRPGQAARRACDRRG